MIANLTANFISNELQMKGLKMWLLGKSPTHRIHVGLMASTSELAEAWTHIAGGWGGHGQSIRLFSTGPTFVSCDPKHWEDHGHPLTCWTSALSEIHVARGHFVLFLAVRNDAPASSDDGLLILINDEEWFLSTDVVNTVLCSWTHRLWIVGHRRWSCDPCV